MSRRSHGYDVLLPKFAVTHEIAAALANAAESTGMSKASILRTALTRYLRDELGLVGGDDPTPLPYVLQRGSKSDA